MKIWNSVLPYSKIVVIRSPWSHLTSNVFEEISRTCADSSAKILRRVQKWIPWTSSNWVSEVSRFPLISDANGFSSVIFFAMAWCLRKHVNAPLMTRTKMSQTGNFILSLEYQASNWRSCNRCQLFHLCKRRCDARLTRALFSFCVETVVTSQEKLWSFVESSGIRITTEIPTTKKGSRRSREFPYCYQDVWILYWITRCLKITEKSLIQHCDRSELRLHFEWTKVN